MTALGPIELSRSHGYCRDCSEPGFAADRVLGLDGRLTRRARRMAASAGVHDPFRKADTLLAELCGWRVCPELIRQLCHAHAADARRRREGLGGLADQFERAEGQDYEIHIDAGKVNPPRAGGTSNWPSWPAATGATPARPRITSSVTCPP
jgi:hypothetical protein